MEPVELLVSKGVDERSLIARDVRVIIDSSHPGTKGGGFLNFEVLTLEAPVCLENIVVHSAAIVEVNNQSLKSEYRNTGRRGLKMKFSCEEGYEFTDDPEEIIEMVENEDEETTETIEAVETPEISEVRLNWNTCSFKNSKCESSNGSPPPDGWLLEGSAGIPVGVKINMECAESNISGLIIESDGNLEQFKIVFIDQNGLIQHLSNPDPLPGTYNAITNTFSVPQSTDSFFLSFDEAVGVSQVRIDVYSSARITGVHLDGREPGAGGGCWGAWTPSPCSSPCGPGSRTSHRSCSPPGACRGDHTRQEGCSGTCSSGPHTKPVPNSDSCLATTATRECFYISGHNEGGALSDKTWAECREACCADQKCKSFDYGTHGMHGKKCYISHVNADEKPDKFMASRDCWSNPLSYNEIGNQVI